MANTTVNTAYETVIGLEVHVELNTETKIFCGCQTSFGAPPNTNVCPICMGHPGTLPVLNEQAVALALKAATALNCEVNQDCKFDRKNYFYPDLPKGYQISQYDKPVGEHGYLEIDVNGEVKRIGITRVHLEEDAGKSMHAEDGTHTLVDYNRTGVPLIEIVSEPDLRSPLEARLYLEAMKSIMQYCNVSDCKMEEGSLRCDANISLRPVGQTAFGEKTELKNMNSFRNVQRGLEYEVERQTKVLTQGEEVLPETRRFDEAKQQTTLMRSKEEAHDYRYFPEPDLVRVHIDDAWLDRVRASLPELPAEKRNRYMENLKLSAYDAGVLTAESKVAQYFETMLTAGTGSDTGSAQATSTSTFAKAASNWVINDLLGYLNANDKTIEQSPVGAVQLADLIRIADSGKISSKQAREVFRHMCESGDDAKTIIKAKGFEQISDTSALIPIIDEAIAKNPQSVEDYRNGKKKAVGALVGQIMKATKGQANPQLVNKLIVERIDEAE